MVNTQSGGEKSFYFSHHCAGSKFLETSKGPTKENFQVHNMPRREIFCHTLYGFLRFLFFLQQREKQQPNDDSRLFSFRREHFSRAERQDKTTSRPLEGAFASRFTELPAEFVCASPGRRDRSSHSRSTRSPRMFITKSDASRSSASTVDVHAASSEDIVKGEDPRANGRSVMMCRDMEGDGRFPANSKVRVRPRRSRRLFVPRRSKRKSNDPTLIFRAKRLLTLPVTRLLPAADEQEIARRSRPAHGIRGCEDVQDGHYSIQGQVRRATPLRLPTSTNILSAASSDVWKFPRQRPTFTDFTD